jgi:hypothetical protein
MKAICPRYKLILVVKGQFQYTVTRIVLCSIVACSPLYPKKIVSQKEHLIIPLGWNRPVVPYLRQ